MNASAGYAPIGFDGAGKIICYEFNTGIAVVFGSLGFVSIL
jgi:hypothetical protein